MIHHIINFFFVGRGALRDCTDVVLRILRFCYSNKVVARKWGGKRCALDPFRIDDRIIRGGLKVQYLPILRCPSCPTPLFVFGKDRHVHVTKILSSAFEGRLHYTLQFVFGNSLEKFFSFHALRLVHIFYRIVFFNTGGLVWTVVQLLFRHEMGLNGFEAMTTKNPTRQPVRKTAARRLEDCFFISFWVSVRES